MISSIGKPGAIFFMGIYGVRETSEGLRWPKLLIEMFGKW